MKGNNLYLVPDYYGDFSCKMGACRHSCCEGWPVSFSMADYFKLLSIDCSPELRQRLDCALHLAQNPTPERYAEILPRYDGKCPMHLPDGRCRLHTELGETVLADVCRLYPRGVRGGNAPECSCANSCEAVLELFLFRQKPLSFETRPLPMNAPHAPERRFSFETAGREQEIRLWLAGFVQKREYPLPQRLLLLGEALQAMDSALAEKNKVKVEALLSGETATLVPEAIEADREQLSLGLDIAERMLKIMDARSESIRSYGEHALAYFGRGENAFERYMCACARFETLIPVWQNWFEHMLVNHMFFARFPFQDRPVILKDEYLALCAVYTLLRFLCVGRVAEFGSTDGMVDAAAAAFRLIEHTEFDRYAAPILRDLGCDDRLHLRQLLCL